jgi:alanine racemase
VRESGKPFAVHLKIDTGMGRLGVWHEYAPALYDAIVANPALRLDGNFTHFRAPIPARSTRGFSRPFPRRHRGEKNLDKSSLLIHADNSAGWRAARRRPFNGVRVGSSSLASGRTRLAPGDVHPEPAFPSTRGSAL